MESFKSLSAWKCAHRLCIETYRETERDYRLPAAPIYSQLRRAVLSVECNIVEGYALRTAPLFRRHVRIALGSAVESERLINIASELGHLRPDVVSRLLPVADRTIGLLYGLLRKLEKK